MEFVKNSSHTSLKLKKFKAIVGAVSNEQWDLVQNMFAQDDCGLMNGNLSHEIDLMYQIPPTNTNLKHLNEPNARIVQSGVNRDSPELLYMNHQI